MSFLSLYCHFISILYLSFVPLKLNQHKETAQICVPSQNYFIQIMDPGRNFMLSKFYTHYESLFLLHYFGGFVYWKISPTIYFDVFPLP